MQCKPWLSARDFEALGLARAVFFSNLHLFFNSVFVRHIETCTVPSLFVGGLFSLIFASPQLQAVVTV